MPVTRSSPARRSRTISSRRSSTDGARPSRPLVPAASRRRRAGAGEPPAHQRARTPALHRRLPPLLLFPQLLDRNRQELFQPLLLLRRHRIELNRGAEHVFRIAFAAPHLHDGAQHLTRDVNPAVARKNERAGRSRFDRRTMHDGGAGEAEIDQLAVDVGELHRNRGGWKPLRATSIFCSHGRGDYTGRRLEPNDSNTSSTPRLSPRAYASSICFTYSAAGRSYARSFP